MLISLKIKAVIRASFEAKLVISTPITTTGMQQVVVSYDNQGEPLFLPIEVWLKFNYFYRSLLFVPLN